jgi:hypothetical protein
MLIYPTSQVFRITMMGISEVFVTVHILTNYHNSLTENLRTCKHMKFTAKEEELQQIPCNESTMYITKYTKPDWI